MPRQAVKAVQAKRRIARTSSTGAVSMVSITSTQQGRRTIREVIEGREERKGFGVVEFFACSRRGEDRLVSSEQDTEPFLYIGEAAAQRRLEPGILPNFNEFRKFQLQNAIFFDCIGGRGISRGDFLASDSWSRVFLQSYSPLFGILVCFSP